MNEWLDKSKYLVDQFLATEEGSIQYHRMMELFLAHSMTDSGMLSADSNVLESWEIYIRAKLRLMHNNQ